MDREIIKGHLPVIILGVLAERPRHGYALCETLSRHAHSKWEIGEGTVYPLLHRLERQGHIRSTWETGSTGRKRKVYRVTRSGKNLVAKHRADWKSLSHLFETFLGGKWTRA